MLTLVPREIENYCQSFTEAESSPLQNIIHSTYEHTQIPQMMVGKLEGAFLRLLVRISGAKNILEIGTFTGYSALAMAEGLPEDGKVITCDIDPESTKIAQHFWNQSPHGQKIELHLGPALETIQHIKGTLDMVFIDADKENYINYYEAVLPLLRKGGLIVLDNILWSGRVLNPEHSSDFALAAVSQHINQDPRVEAVILSVRDGMTLAYKR